MYLRQLKVGPPSVFAYLLGDRESGEALVIDPAAEPELLTRTASEAGLTIKTIVNTHGHGDHVCGNAAMKALTGAEIIQGRGDEKYQRGQWAEFNALLGFKPSPPVDRFVGDGDEIIRGRLRLQVITTPGHSPGGICLYTPGDLFCGDTILIGRIALTDVPGGSWPDLAASLTEKIRPLPPDTILWPGHQMGPELSSTIGRELARNAYAQLLG